ncbi:MAG: hypothetical protein CL878_14215 [Dehalococcoidia bacterium]|nr:hypothetical protein [Dehalococcoidia bacterium]
MPSVSSSLLPLLGLLAATALGAAVGLGVRVCSTALIRTLTLSPPFWRCGACGASLPFTTWLRAGWGRPRHPDCPAGDQPAGIPVWVLALATASLFGLAAAVFGAGLQLVLAWGFTILLLVISAVDVQRRLILDRLTYPAMAVGPLFAWLWPELSLRASFVGGLTALVLFTALVLIYRRGMGLGDLKLATMIGLYLGWPHVLAALVAAFLLGGLAAVAILLAGGSRKSTFAYGPVLSAAAILVLLGSGSPLE